MRRMYVNLTAALLKFRVILISDRHVSVGNRIFVLFTICDVCVSRVLSGYFSAKRLIRGPMFSLFL